MKQILKFPPPPEARHWLNRNGRLLIQLRFYYLHLMRVQTLTGMGGRGSGFRFFLHIGHVLWAFSQIIRHLTWKECEQWLFAIFSPSRKSSRHIGQSACVENTANAPYRVCNNEIKCKLVTDQQVLMRWAHYLENLAMLQLNLRSGHQRIPFQFKTSCHRCRMTNLSKLKNTDQTCNG